MTATGPLGMPPLFAPESGGRYVVTCTLYVYCCGHVSKSENLINR